MQTRTLHDAWRFCAGGLAPDYHQPQLQRPSWMPAEVPGFVHLDLVREGVIADPFVRKGEIGAAWVDETDWSYRTVFAWSPAEGLPRRVLRFAGLDTVCEIFLNGQKVGEKDNMFVPLEIDVTDLLKEENELRVDFRSAVKVGQERRRAYFDANGIDWKTQWFDERAFVRKAQYMSGWDWGPRLVSCGVWGTVELLEFAGRIKSVSFFQERLIQSVNDPGGVPEDSRAVEDPRSASTHFPTPKGSHSPEGSATPPGSESLSTSSGGLRPPGYPLGPLRGRFRVWAEADTEGEGTLSFEVDGRKFGPGEPVEIEADLWWPVGEGPQTLLPARATFGEHTVEKRIGLRTIRLLREKDEHGRSFEFEVNGRRVYARGANWIPDDSFVTRTDPARVRDFTKLNFNMLRVWGGGFYESEAFYDACDEAGIMVWQDFPYGCSYYPDSDKEVALARDEAAHHVRRLRDRASLALWCGNNENEVLWLGKWGGKELAPARYYGERLYNESLPQAVAEHGNGTDYIRTSPLGFENEDPSLTDRAERFGDSHYWDVWHGRGDWRFYDESETRFSSEYGFASSPSDDVWRFTLGGSTGGSTVPVESIQGRPAPEPSPLSPDVWWHNKTGKTPETFTGYVEIHYPKARTLEDWTYYSQLNQRDAMRHGVEHFRRSPYCRGSLIWQINDCWPVQSWAMEDYHRLLKPAGQEMARVYAPTLVSLVLTETGVEAWLVHDGPEPESGVLRLQAVDTLDGTMRELGRVEASLRPGERLQALELDLAGLDRGRTALVATLDGRPETARWAFLSEPKDIRLGAPRISARVEGDRLILHVEGFAADLVLWDAADPRAILGPWTGLPGRAAVTVANGTASYPLSGKATDLRARTLSGETKVHKNG